MKAKILITLLLLVSGAAYSQVNRDDRKACQKLAKSHVKSMVQIDYPYVYDMNSGSSKPSTTGTKVESQTYDLKGNTTQDIVYDDYGNISAKTVSKYDARGNSIEDIVYNSDGTINSKAVHQYNKDTIILDKVYNPDGTINNVKYTRTVHRKDTVNNKNCLIGTSYFVGFYLQKDSTLVSEIRYVYDDAGNLIYILLYKSDNGSSIYLVQKDEWKYNQKNEMVEHDSYAQDINSSAGLPVQTYKYDESGNQIEIVELARGSGTNNYVYKNDAKGLPISAIKYDNSNNPVRLTKWTYTYYQ